MGELEGVLQTVSTANWVVPRLIKAQNLETGFEIILDRIRTIYAEKPPITSGKECRPHHQEFS